MPPRSETRISTRQCLLLLDILKWKKIHIYLTRLCFAETDTKWSRTAEEIKKRFRWDALMVVNLRP